MIKNIRVLIIEEDPYASNWMALLLARDWRTQVVSETGGLDAACERLRTNRAERVDVFLTDAEIINDGVLARIEQCLAERRNTKILLVGDTPRRDIFDSIIVNTKFIGYLLKAEINYSLAWAIDLAIDGYWVNTPGIRQMINQLGRSLPKKNLTMDGRKPLSNLTEHEIRIARLALIFSLERRDLSDEIEVSEDWSYGLISELYKKLGIAEIISGEVDPVDYLGDDPVMVDHFQRIIREYGHSKKARDKETLAFHLLTKPEIFL